MVFGRNQQMDARRVKANMKARRSGMKKTSESMARRAVARQGKAPLARQPASGSKAAAFRKKAMSQAARNPKFKRGG